MLIHPTRSFSLLTDATPPPSSSATAPANTTTPMTGTGRWTDAEHRLFLHGLEQHGNKEWKKIATLIKSRTVVQIRTHAQKYFQKLAKTRPNGEGLAGVDMGTAGGAVVTSVPPMVHIGTAEGIAIPVGLDGQPVVTTRTATHPNSSANPGNMSLGDDPSSMAAAGSQVGFATVAGMSAAGGGRKRRNADPVGGGTQRRAIGNVVSPRPALSNVLDPCVATTTIMNSNAIVADPQARIPIAHTQYHPPLAPTPAPGTSHPQGIPSMPPMGVIDMSLLSSWVDAENTLSLYNVGSDIDTLLEDAYRMGFRDLDMGDEQTFLQELCFRQSYNQERNK